MLRLKPNPTFKAPVTIDDHDGQPMPFIAVFRHMRPEEYTAMLERSKTSSELDTVAEFLVGWEEVDGEFSRDALGGLLADYRYAGFRLSEAYARALTEGRRGN